MLNTKKFQKSKSIYPQQPKAFINSNQTRSVRQDKPAKAGGRSASPQPAPRQKNPRAEQTTAFSARSQKRPSYKNRTVHLTLWVDPIVKEELQRIAKREGISVSAAGAAFLKKALQQDLDMKYGALLEPLIQKILTRHMRNLALLLVRAAFSTEQTRGLVTNILGRQQGMTPELLNDILDASRQSAKSKITTTSPQLEDLIADVQRWFSEQDTKKN